MKLKVLGSGSSGNCYILENDDEALIIEAGVPFMEVKKALNFNVMKIVGVLASHVHGDHAKYIDEYKRAGIKHFSPYDMSHHISAECNFMGNFRIKDFANSDKSGRWLHNNGDGSECPCYGFCIMHPDIGSLVYATDTEYVRWRFKGVNHILCEANYDMQFVNRDEPNYEHRLRGHMSLPTALDFISTNDNPNLRTVCLLHLSASSSDAELFLKKAKETVKYGADCHIAQKGLNISLDLLPF